MSAIAGIAHLDGRVLVEMALGSARFRLTLQREEMAKQIDLWVDRDGAGS